MKTLLMLLLAEDISKVTHEVDCSFSMIGSEVSLFEFFARTPRTNHYTKSADFALFCIH